MRSAMLCVTLSWSLLACGGEASEATGSVEGGARPCDPLASVQQAVPVDDPLDVGLSPEGVRYLIDQVDGSYAVFVGDDAELEWLPVDGIRDSDVGSVSFLVLNVDDGGPDGFTLGHDVRSGRPRQMAVAVGQWSPRSFEDLLAVGQRLTVVGPSIDDDVVTYAERASTLTHVAELPGGDWVAVVQAGEGPDADVRLFLGPRGGLAEWPVEHVLRSGDATSIDFGWGDGVATVEFAADEDGPTGVVFHHDDVHDSATWRMASDLDEAAYLCL